MHFRSMVAAAFVAVPAASFAGVDLGEVDDCVAKAMGAGTNPAACADAAQVECQRAPKEAPAIGTLCFVEAEQVWQDGLRGLMTRLKSDAPEQIAAIAGIELRYDLLTARLQCDRFEELSRAVGADPEERIQRQKARCAATVAGHAYVHLFWRARAYR